MRSIAFTRPSLSGQELKYLESVIAARRFGTNERFSMLCRNWLTAKVGPAEAFVTQSCTRALELAASIADIKPGDEVVMPSFAFPSIANAVVQRGGVPVFVDVRRDTLNLDEHLLEDAITDRTVGVTVVHYAGVCAEMDKIAGIAASAGLTIFEDAAQAMLSTYRGRPAGSLGDFGCFSFHQTKNIAAGECGALMIAESDLLERAHAFADKGTNRFAFDRGAVASYQWVECGSSAFANEVTAAILYAQLEIAEDLLALRRRVWDNYHAALEHSEADGHLRRPTIPDHCGHNAHIYHIRVKNQAVRDALVQSLRRDGIEASIHFTPLHSSPAGMRFGRHIGRMEQTDSASAELVRLPLYSDLPLEDCRFVAEKIRCFFEQPDWPFASEQQRLELQVSRDRARAAKCLS